MSGGSYNYFCFATAEGIHAKVEDLSRMRDRLVALGYMDAAKETESLILIIQQSEVRIDAHIERLGRVWRSVEWFDSGDYGEDAIRDAIDGYRGDLSKT